MATYLKEDLRTLPDQVQKNKEDIEEVKEVLENIDPEEVSTIISDIEELKNGQNVQNIAIESNRQATNTNATSIANEVADRTALINKNSQGNITIYNNSKDIYIQAPTTGSNVGIYGGSYAYLQSSTRAVVITDTNGIEAVDSQKVELYTDVDGNNNTVVLDEVGNFEVNNGHSLKFDTTGSLTIDGTPVSGGGGSDTLYQHNIKGLYNAVDYLYSFEFTIITNNNTSFDSSSLASYLYNNNMRNNNAMLNSHGFIYGKSANSTYHVRGAYSSTGTAFYLNAINISSSVLEIIYQYTITDTVVQVS